MSNTHHKERRVVIVTSILVAADAISQAALDSYRILTSLPATRAIILTSHSDIENAPVRLVAGLGGLLKDPDFLAADLVLYHFGIHSPLFDGMLVGNGRAKQVVRFHNVTPPHLVAPSAVPLVEASLRQVSNFQCADAIWADSRTNAKMLCDIGYALPDAQVIPLVVDTPSLLAPRDKEYQGQIEILFIGRIVRAKGVLDLLDAFAPLARSGVKARLSLVGNKAFSDRKYQDEVSARAQSIGAAVEFLGEVSDETRNQLLNRAHILAIPSYHEGFCKPVVEGLRAGCIPVGYAAYNLPDICGELGRLVNPGDIVALGEALHELIDDLSHAALDPTRSVRIDRGELLLPDLGGEIEAHLRPFSFDTVREQTAGAVIELERRGIAAGGAKWQRHLL